MSTIPIRTAIPDPPGQKPTRISKVGPIPKPHQIPRSDNRRILLTGSSGFLGSEVKRHLRGLEQVEVVGVRSADANLTDPLAVDRLFYKIRPDVVVHLACPYGGGGIGYANAHPASLALGMVQMDSLLIAAAHKYQARTFVGVGSVCAYPQEVTFPTGEDQLWAGHPEPINAPYGLAKRMQLTLLQAARKEWGLNGIHLILANLYGPGDKFGTGTVGHVIPSTIVKCVEAKEDGQQEIVAWGDGSPTREFLYVEDAAQAIAMAVEYEAVAPLPRVSEPLNICSGEEWMIRHVVDDIAKLVGFQGTIRWDASKPNGQPRRWFSNARAKEDLGWAPEVSFRVGLKRTVEWYLRERAQVMT